METMSASEEHGAGMAGEERVRSIAGSRRRLCRWCVDAPALILVGVCVVVGACVSGSSALSDTLPTTSVATTSIGSNPTDSTDSTNTTNTTNTTNPTNTTNTTSAVTTDTGGGSDTVDSSTSSATTAVTSETSAECDTPIEGLVTAHAYFESQAPPPDTSGSGGSSDSSTGNDVDPDTLYITLSDALLSCEDPDAPLGCGPRWSVTMVLPPEFQGPGTYEVGTEDVLGVFSETGEDEGGGECSFGGGSWGATLEVISIGDGVVEGRLCEVDASGMSVMPVLNGLFTADLCP